MVVDQNHDPVTAYCVRRLKLHTYSRQHTHSEDGLSHPYDLGANVYCDSFYDAQAVEAATRLVKATRYFGPITVEFRRNPLDDNLMLIKCDPRVVRATSLSTALALDQPTTVYDVFTGRQPEVSAYYPEGVAWIWLSQFFEALWNNHENLEVRQELFALLRNLRRVKSFAFLDWRDPGPFIMHMQWRARTWLNQRFVGLGNRLARKFRWRVSINSL